MVAEGHRLRHLHVGEAGHHRLRMDIGLVEQGGDQVAEGEVEAVDGVAHPQPEVRCHLVVAAATGVQAARRRADQLPQPVLHIHVNIFQRRREFKPALLDLTQNCVQTVIDRCNVIPCQDTLCSQHVGMRLRSPDVLGMKALVEIDGGIDLLHHLRGAAGETAAPHLIAGGFV